MSRRTALEGARLAAILADWEAASPVEGPAVGRDPRVIDALKALGYVQ